MVRSAALQPRSLGHFDPLISVPSFLCVLSSVLSSSHVTQTGWLYLGEAHQTGRNWHFFSLFKEMDCYTDLRLT